METIYISVYDKRLDEMGIETEDEYVPFNFKADKLIGYWVAYNKDSPAEIMVYIGGNTFVAEYNEENIKLLDGLLEN